MSKENNEIVEESTRLWLKNVVIGLNLCPFAGKPQKENRIRFIISQAATEEVLLAELQDELEYLDNTAVEKVETTLLILPALLSDFYDYNDFLDVVDRLIEHGGWEGIYQVASFHPDYCFAGVEPSSQENLTNRSPYPILHILREQSLEEAIDYYPDVDEIPNRNIQKVKSLSPEEIKKLFGG